MKILNDHTGHADGRIKLEPWEARELTRALVAYYATRAADQEVLILARDMNALARLLKTDD